MHAQDYLTLRLVRLKSSEEWPLNREGLATIFVRGIVAGKRRRDPLPVAILHNFFLPPRSGMGHEPKQF